MNHPGRLHIAVIILMALVLTQGCYYDQVLPEPDPEPTDTVSFSMDVLPIFNQSCNISGCHSPGSITPDLSPANAYNSLLTQGYIDVAVPENSELYQWMSGTREFPMPITGSQPVYNGIVLAWIKEGAKNN